MFTLHETNVGMDVGNRQAVSFDFLSTLRKGEEVRTSCLACCAGNDKSCLSKFCNFFTFGSDFNMVKIARCGSFSYQTLSLELLHPNLSFF